MSTYTGAWTSQNIARGWWNCLTTVFGMTRLRSLPRKADEVLPRSSSMVKTKGHVATLELRATYPSRIPSGNEDCGSELRRLPSAEEQGAFRPLLGGRERSLLMRSSSRRASTV